MLRPIDKDRLHQIHQLLMNIATGDFSYQIPRTTEDDEIESLLVLVNLISEEMRETLKYYSALRTNETIQQYVSMVLVLDHSFAVTFVNHEVLKVLELDENQIVGHSFSTLLSPCSKEHWKTHTQQLLQKSNFHSIVSLEFLTSTGLLRTMACAVTTISTPSSSPSILVTTFASTTISKLFEDVETTSLELRSPNHLPGKNSGNVLTQESDIRIIQEVRDYIIKHLEGALPRLKELAHQFGTNEYKLKTGFRQLYGISVFRFLARERLNRARLLIQNTTLPLKSIVKMTGFKNVSHFSTAFKQRFGVTPSALRRG